jgi:hypothetical protein
MLHVSRALTDAEQAVADQREAEFRARLAGFVEETRAAGLA